MAFTSISSTLIAIGKAVKRELWLTTKNNFDDHESRLLDLETAGSLIQIFDVTVLGADAATLTGLELYRAKQAIKIVRVQVQIFEKGSISSGTLSIDCKKSSTLGGSFSTILTTQGSINFATDPDYTSDDAVINSSLNSLAIDEFIRIDVTSLPATPLGRFRFIAYGEIE